MFSFKSTLKRLIRTGEFGRNVRVLVGGTALAQIINIATLPILTRLYSPEEFGLLASYLGLVAIVVAVASLRFEVAIPLPNSDLIAANLLFLSMLCVFLISFIAALIAIYMVFYQPELVGDLLFLVLLAPVSVLFNGCLNVFQFWVSRKKEYKLLAGNKIIQTAFGSGAKMGAGVAGMDAQGLVLGQIVQHAVGGVGIFLKIKTKIKYYFNFITFSSLKKTFLKYSEFPKYSLWEALASIAGMQVPVLLIASQVSAEAGFLTLAMQLLSVPMGLIGGSAAQVYIVQAAEKARNGALYEFTLKTVSALAKLASAPLLFAIILLPTIIPIVFGDQWNRAGIIASWLVPFFFLQFIVSPVSMSLHIMKKQKVALILQLVGFVLRAGGVAIVVVQNPDFAVFIYAITSAIFYLAYLVVVAYEAKKYEQEYSV